MNAPSAPRPSGWSRRSVLGLASAAVGLATLRHVWGGPPVRRLLHAEDSGVLSPFERLHFPLVRLPLVATNGAKVPVVVEMAHPMEPDHFITSVQMVNERDPVPVKGVFAFTPTNGQVYVAFQVRMDAGTSEVAVTAECSRHGRWSRTQPVTVPDGKGGCAASAPPPGGTVGDEILPPRIRIPALVKRTGIRPGEIFDVQLEMRHPSRTGLMVRDGKWVQVTEPFYLTEMEVVVGPERVSRFALTSALSDDPFITFRLRVQQEGLLRILLRNNRGQRFETTHQLRFT